MAPPQIRALPDGKRMHFQHGPIDLIVAAEGPGQDLAIAAAANRFQTILEELVAELPDLRRPLCSAVSVAGPTAQRMARAVGAHTDVFVTPMASVAGAVADEVLAAMVAAGPVEKAYVNNGGDIAFHLGANKTFLALGPSGQIEVPSGSDVRGIASSGWQGRSHSLGIADAVTVLASNAAKADVAATLVANAVDLPGHPAIKRCPARELAPDSDLGDRLVTVAVGPLSEIQQASALDAGLRVARDFEARGLIHAAALRLGAHLRTTNFTAFGLGTKEVIDA